MRNIKLVIEYDGSRYDSWQSQPGNLKSITVQDKIEAVISKMTDEDISIIGAARTEAGVHAYGQVANFETNSDMKLHEIKHYLNRYLPRDISIIHVLEEKDRFHSSFNAKSFKYVYKIEMGDVASVFKRKYCYYSFDKLDIRRMEKAAKKMVGKHDFKAFSDNKRMKKSTEREILDITFAGNDSEVEIMIHADDFWPNLARIIVGTLIEVGANRIAVDDIDEIITSKKRELAGPTAQASGLFLKEVLF